MKKAILLLTSVLLSLGLVKSQVGINTENPQGIFHIDGLQNTSGSTNFTDDVLITTTGNVGIGTLAPSAKLEIQTTGTSATPVKGFKLVDGNEALGKVLTSDVNGLATWQQPGFSEFTQIPTAVCPIPTTVSGNIFIAKKTDGTPYTITFPGPGTYSVTMGVLLQLSSVDIDNAYLQLVPGNNPSLWSAATPRFIGSYEIAGVAGIFPTERHFYLSENIVITNSGTNNTGLIAYVALIINTSSIPPFTGTPFTGTVYIGPNAASPQQSGGSFIRIN